MRDLIQYPSIGSRYPDHGSVSGSRAIAVGGGLLGTGASTVAALLSVTASMMGHEVLLIDVDAESRLLQLLGPGGARERVDVEAVVAGAGQMVRVRDGLHLLRARAHGMAGMPPRHLLERFELVIVDAGWRMDSVLETCAMEVDRVLVVTTPGRAAISASYGLIKAVETRFPGTRFEVLVNQQDPHTAGHAVDHLQTAALRFLQRAVAVAGVIPDDPCLRAGLRGGMSVQDAAAESEVSRVIEQIVVRLLSDLDGPSFLPAVQRFPGEWRIAPGSADRV